MLDTKVIPVNEEEVIHLTEDEKLALLVKNKSSETPFPREICNTIKSFKEGSKELHVYVEHDYSKFFLTKINRPIDYKRCNEYSLYSLKKKINFFARNPIIVNSLFKPGLLTITEGQHRFIGSKLLYLPIYYFLANEIPVTDVTKLNSNQKNWKILQYINSFMEQGNPNYKQIIEFFEEHNDIDPSVLLYILKHRSGLRGDVFNEKLRNGEFVINDIIIEKIKVFFTKLEIFNFHEYYKTRNFITGLLKLMTHKKYDHNHMLEKSENYRDKFYKCNSGDGAFIMLQNIYNLNKRHNKIK